MAYFKIGYPDSNGSWNVMRVDKDGVIEARDSYANEIFRGYHFYIGSYAVLNSGGSVIFAVTTPNTNEWVHMRFVVDATTTTKVEVYEDSSVTGGTPQTPINSNRNSSKQASLSVVLNPTVNSLGSLIDSNKFGSSSKPSVFGGDVAREDEIVLKQNTTYIYKFTSEADNNTISYRGYWYERAGLW